MIEGISLAKCQSFYLRASVQSTCLSKDLLDRIRNRLRVQVPVAAPHGLGLVADKLINDPLVYPLVRQSGNEAVPKDVIPFQHRPFRAALGFRAGFRLPVLRPARVLAHYPHERFLDGLHGQLAEQPAIYDRECREGFFQP